MEQTKHTEKARQELREIAEGMDINKLLDIVVFGQKRNGVFEHVLVERVERLSDPSTKQMIAERLWALLDDIDTASDMFKPVDLDGYKAFYDYAMKKSVERHKYMKSNGCKLVEVKGE